MGSVGDSVEVALMTPSSSQEISCCPSLTVLVCSSDHSKRMNKPENVINKTPIDKISLVKTSEAHIQPTILPTGYSGSLHSEGQLGIGPVTLCFPFLCLMPQLLFVPAACYVKNDRRNS